MIKRHRLEHRAAEGHDRTTLDPADHRVGVDHHPRSYAVHDPDHPDLHPSVGAYLAQVATRPPFSRPIAMPAPRHTQCPSDQAGQARPAASLATSRTCAAARPRRPAARPRGAGAGSSAGPRQRRRPARPGATRGRRCWRSRTAPGTDPGPGGNRLARSVGGGSARIRKGEAVGPGVDVEEIPRNDRAVGVEVPPARRSPPSGAGNRTGIPRSGSSAPSRAGRPCGPGGPPRPPPRRASRRSLRRPAGRSPGRPPGLSRTPR